jgi:hypothetical protein
MIFDRFWKVLMECLESAMSAYFENVQYMYIMMELLSNLL